ncbi:hypothetical protein GCM10012275_24590 [Longimycelium tulufanense]|uniref:Uncharacterized protein n=1 Tax=Longimycelium tulufanense TaxID=907463 RepID=A0A8J3FTW7_9PSEU|nr:hypothetical protein [Longimycelium tulufanense]GGM52677.1 hypothetical protein GCM10012275_24590 [Longimycelium tulufanense]
MHVVQGGSDRHFHGGDNYASMSLEQLKDLLGSVSDASGQSLAIDFQKRGQNAQHLADMMSQLATALTGRWHAPSVDRAKDAGDKLRTYGDEQHGTAKEISYPFQSFATTAKVTADKVRELDVDGPAWPETVSPAGLDPVTLALVKLDQARYEQEKEAKRQEAIELGRQLDATAQQTDAGTPIFAEPPSLFDTDSSGNTNYPQSSGNEPTGRSGVIPTTHGTGTGPVIPPPAGVQPNAVTPPPTNPPPPSTPPPQSSSAWTPVATPPVANPMGYVPPQDGGGPQPGHHGNKPPTEGGHQRGHGTVPPGTPPGIGPGAPGRGGFPPGRGPGGGITNSGTVRGFNPGGPSGPGGPGGPGGGFGGPGSTAGGQPGTGQGPGATGARGGAAPGRPAGSIMQPAGMGGAGTGRGEEDKEHQSRVPIDGGGLFDDDRLVAPPVIGELPPNYRD